MFNQTLLRHVVLLLLGCLLFKYHSAEDCRYQFLLPGSCYIDSGSSSDVILPCTIETCSNAAYTCDYTGTGQDFSYLVFYCNTNNSTRLNCTFRRASWTLYNNLTALFNVCLINEGGTCNILTRNVSNCVLNSYSVTHASTLTALKIATSTLSLPSPLNASTTNPTPTEWTEAEATLVETTITPLNTTELNSTNITLSTSLFNTTNSTIVKNGNSSDKRQLITISVAVPLGSCIIASLIVGVFIWRCKVRKTRSQGTKVTKVVSARNNRTGLNNVLLDKTLVKEVQNENHVYNHPDSRDSNYINSAMSQYTICTESVDKRDVPVDTYGNNLIERIVSPEITTNKTVLSKGDRDDEKDENELNRNDLNSQYDSQQPTQNGYCEITLLDQSLQDVTGYSRLSVSQDKHHTYEKFKK
ncbi:uncharacterized protein LOC129929003 [Biomphalaria glabrata]|uniref:Uncharacterized protein LOC129929003 n=1 Tax=Biomphalaria glabrata TaxID=6526 RepID=A0A9W3BQ76_BIOGL|nr:uncharacterized protein LOC129929003 [Biomphalaria glabrata]